MRVRTIWILLLGVTFLAGCDLLGSRWDGGGLGGEVIYTNSFEAPADTAGWYGYGTLELREQAPSGGGDISAYVSGGCPAPHSAYVFEAPEDTDLVLRTWAKNLAIGGLVRLKNIATGKEVHVQVKDEAWKQIESQETLAVSKGDSLRLAMDAGGFAASAMLVTRVEVAPTGSGADS